MKYDILEFAETLLQLDPLRGYPERAAAAIAQMTQAASFQWIREGSDGATPSDEAHESVTVPVRGGRDQVGTIHLLFVPGTINEDTMRLARWGARMMGRGISYAQRLAAQGARRDGEDIEAALARSPLTPRERDVVSRLVAGLSTRDIAGQTGLTVATVNTYLKRIFSKLGVHSRVELIARVAGTARELDRDDRQSMVVPALGSDPLDSEAIASGSIAGTGETTPHAAKFGEA